jgi:amino acid transporter
MRKAVPLVLAAVLAVLAVLGFTSGSTALVVLGVVAALLAAALVALYVTVLRDPEAAIDRLAARRSELEVRAGRVPTPSTEVTEGPSSQDQDPAAAPAALNREQRRAQERKQ